MKADNNIPKSSCSSNTFNDFYKICRAYYDELMHISKEENPSLSKEDILVIDDLIKEILEYSNELTSKMFITEAKKILDIGLVISDFLLKIFGKFILNNQNLEEKQTKITNYEENLSEKLHYPLSLKLQLLEKNFHILFQYERDYDFSEKNINEIIEIQKYIQISKHNLGSSKFFLALIKFFNKDLNASEKLALEAKGLFEVKENESSDALTTRKISKVLQFLAEIYKIKNDGKAVLSCYENAYYLNLGKFGNENMNTQFFKTKLDLASEEYKLTGAGINSKNAQFYLTGPPSPPTDLGELDKKLMNANINVNNNTSTSHSNMSKSIKNLNSPKNNSNNTDVNLSGFSNNNVSNPNVNIANDIPTNIVHKGKAYTYSFKIPTSSLYDPLVISIYSLGKNDNNRYSSDLFVGNLLFDKKRLMRFLGEKQFCNRIFYTDENLNLLFCNIALINGSIALLNNDLKSSLISSSVPIKSIF